MSRTKRTLIRVSKVVAVLVLIAAVLSFMKTRGQEAANPNDNVATEQWEYLALSGPTTTLTPVNDSKLRKEPNAAFRTEAFVLEQHLDKLGANGWELVAIAGPPTDPAYYFRRRK